MTKYHGKNTRVYLNGYDMSGYANSVGVTSDAQTADVTAFSDPTVNYVLGLYNNEITHDGLFDDTASAGGHAVLSSNIGGTGLDIGIAIGTFQGANGYAGTVEVESMYSLSAQAKSAVLFKSKFLNAGTPGLDLVNWVETRNQHSGTGVAWDSGTATNNGGRVYLQNFGSYNAANAAQASGSVRLVGGTDSAFTAAGTVLLADFGAVGTAPSSSGIQFSGTAPRFLHVDCYSGTPQIAIAIERL